MDEQSRAADSPENHYSSARQLAADAPRKYAACHQQESSAPCSEHILYLLVPTRQPRWIVKFPQYGRRNEQDRNKYSSTHAPRKFFGGCDPKIIKCVCKNRRT